MTAGVDKCELKGAQFWRGPQTHTSVSFTSRTITGSPSEDKNEIFFQQWKWEWIVTILECQSVLLTKPVFFFFLIQIYFNWRLIYNIVLIFPYINIKRLPNPICIRGKGNTQCPPPLAFLLHIRKKETFVKSTAQSHGIHNKLET